MNYLTKDEGIRIINKLLNERVRDFYSYNKIIKEKLSITRNIPIYISDDIVLLPIKRYNDFDCMWINYKRIDTFLSYDGKTIIKFIDKSVKTFEISQKKLERIIKNAIIIIDYFHKFER